jgi:hypothetical protein
MVSTGRPRRASFVRTRSGLCRHYPGIADSHSGAGSSADNVSGVVDFTTVGHATTSALAPGSHLVISHLTGDLAPGPVAAGIDAYNDVVPTAVTPRSHAQVTALFGGLPLVPPGVVPVAEWRPTAGPAAQADLYAGIARHDR